MADLVSTILTYPFSPQINVKQIPTHIISFVINFSKYVIIFSNIQESFRGILSPFSLARSTEQIFQNQYQEAVLSSPLPVLGQGTLCLVLSWPTVFIPVTAEIVLTVICLKPEEGRVWHLWAAGGSSVSCGVGDLLPGCWDAFPPLLFLSYLLSLPHKRKEQCPRVLTREHLKLCFQDSAWVGTTQWELLLQKTKSQRYSMWDPEAADMLIYFTLPNVVKTAFSKDNRWKQNWFFLFV